MGKKMNNKIKAVIFDMDGTILNTEHVYNKVRQDFLLLHGAPVLTPEEQKLLAKRCSGLGVKEFIKLLKADFRLQASVEELHSSYLDISDKRIYHSETSIDYVPGFDFFHQQISLAGLPSSIATNHSSPEKLQKLIDRTLLEKFFGNHIYCTAHVDFKAKPDPALFLHAAKQLGVNPEECVVFEDSFPGFKAAKAAGMKCIAIKTDYNLHVLDHVHDAIDDYHQAEAAVRALRF
jgi:beta-phosphoglucomutase